MLIKYVRPLMPRIKGPYIFLDDDGKSYRIDIGKTLEVPEHVGHKMLSQNPDILEKAKAPRKKAVKAAPKNKMVKEAPQNKAE